MIHCSAAGPQFPDESLVLFDVALVWSIWIPGASQDSLRIEEGIEERSLQPKPLHRVKCFGTGVLTDSWDVTSKYISSQMEMEIGF